MKKMFFVLILSLLASGALGWAEGESVTLYKPSLRGAQCELVTYQGTRIYIDVSNESLLSTPPTASDILLTTHGHHACNLVNTFPGEQLKGVGEIKRSDVYIKCIPGAHLPGDKLTETVGSNYLFIIEIAGIRFAHFGGIGQDVFTPFQLKEMGRVDVAITILGSAASIADIDNLKAFNLMDQIKPKMVISTHVDIDTAKYGAELWETYYSNRTSIQMSSSEINGSRTKLLFMGDGAGQMAKITKVPQWPY